MMNNELAIVIPFYKDDFFEETLLSLCNQTNKKFNVYIGDDASLNNVTHIIDKYNKDLSINYHRFAENLGGISLTRQWSRCLELINNESWICILGDDDCLSESFVESFYKKLPKMDEEKSNVMRFASIKIDKMGNKLGIKQLNPELQSAPDSFIDKFYGEKHSSLSEYIFSNESYKKHGFRNYPMAWCSDDMAWLEFSEGHKIVSTNEAYIKFRLSPKSISGTLNNKKQDAKCLFFEDLILEKDHIFSRTNAIKNLKKYEVFLVLTKGLKKTHFWFFLIRFYKYKSQMECVKFIRRFCINILK